MRQWKPGPWLPGASRASPKRLRSRDTLYLQGDGGGRKTKEKWTYCTSSLVPRPTCAFHFSAAESLVLFLTCVTCRLEGNFFCVGEYSCSSQTIWKVVNLYFLQLLFRVCLYHRPSAETMSPAKGREVQPSFEQALPTRNK